MGESRDLFQNTKRSYYGKYAAHPLSTRLKVVSHMIVPVYGYFYERQSNGCLPWLPTFTEIRWLDRLADYILAEDHKRGLSLRTRAHIQADEDEDYAPIGNCALKYADYMYYLSCVDGALTPEETRRLKTCEVCGCEFIDRSRSVNAKTCRYPCNKRKDAVRKRKERNGDVRLRRYRERQDLEYPFYSPVELREISERGETVREDIGDAITRAEMRQIYGKKTPTDITMDSDIHYSPNSYKQWRESDGVDYPVITYNLYDERRENEECLGHAA